MKRTTGEGETDDNEEDGNTNSTLGSETDLPEKVRAIRKKCSLYYVYFATMAKERNTSDIEEPAYVDLDTATMDCPKDNYKNVITFNPICHMEVVCDNYGCFDYYLADFRDSGNETHRCPSCGHGRCWEYDMVESFGNHSLSTKMVKAMYTGSRTSDFSDLLGVYSPSKGDVRKYSPQAREFILTCSYDRKPCSNRQFYVWMSDQFGMCYTFNSEHREIRVDNENVRAKARKTISTGPMHGLRLTLNISEDQYLSLLSPDIGARVIVHSPMQLPFPEEEGFNVSPDGSVSIKVARKVIERVGPPHGKCKSETGSSNFTEYSSLRCKKLCLEEEYWRACKCYVGKSPVYHRDENHIEVPEEACSPFNVGHKVCMQMVQYKNLKGKLECDCPPACAETVYLPEVTVSEDNKNFFTIVQNLKKLKVDDTICESGGNAPVRIHVYMDSLSYEKITESPAYTWDTLICNVGGNLGLFLGMSIVTLVELVEFLFDLTTGCCCARGHRGHIHASAPDMEPESVPQPPEEARLWHQDEVIFRRRPMSAAFNRVFLGE